MRTIIVFLLLFCGFCCVSFAQTDYVFDPAADKPLRCIAQMGIGHQWGKFIYPSTTWSVERPLSHYRHVGIQANIMLPKRFDISSSFLGPVNYSEVRRNSFEIGGFLKYFLHGRFTGRKSGVYIGPELRIGQRKIIRYLTSSSDPDQPSELFTQNTLKILFRWGQQVTFGNAVLEWSLPIGFENIKIRRSGNVESDFGVVFLPSLTLGLAL
jgi:hypothetical protein